MIEIPRLRAEERLVVPAKAGIQILCCFESNNVGWIPACAGMTGNRSRVSVEKSKTARLGAEGRSDSLSVH